MTRANATLTVEPDQTVWGLLDADERQEWLDDLIDAAASVGHVSAWNIEVGDASPEESPERYDWVGWEAEPEMTGDGSGDPDKHFITIRDPEGEEYALIVHRTVGGKFPLDGDVANEKIARADRIVAALNASLRGGN